MNGKSAKMYLGSDRVFITKRMGRHLANQTIRLAVRQQPDPIEVQRKRTVVANVRYVIYRPLALLLLPGA